MSLVFESLRRLTGETAVSGPVPVLDGVETVQRLEQLAASKWETAFKAQAEEAHLPAVTAIKGPTNEVHLQTVTEMPRPRPVGTPLQIGRYIPTELTAPTPSIVQEPVQHAPVPSVQQAVATLCAAIPPLVERMLPLLEGMDSQGGAGSAIQNSSFDLVPIQSDIVEMRTQHSHLCDKVEEQNEAIKRAEDRLTLLCEATDRSTLEQKEMIEDLRDLGSRVNKVAIFALVLLAVSVALDVVLFLRLPGH